MPEGKISQEDIVFKSVFSVFAVSDKCILNCLGTIRWRAEEFSFVWKYIRFWTSAAPLRKNDGNNVCKFSRKSRNWGNSFVLQISWMTWLWALWEAKFFSYLTLHSSFFPFKTWTQPQHNEISGARTPAGGNLYIFVLIIWPSAQPDNGCNVELSSVRF